jgi:hypothetical protein
VGVPFKLSPKPGTLGGATTSQRSWALVTPNSCTATDHLPNFESDQLLGGRMRDLRSMSDVEFEQLCGDLLGADSGTHFERFKRAADGGVDLRSRDQSGALQIVQCKHYVRTTFSGLYRDLAKEVANVEVEQPTIYWVATSSELTRYQKDKIHRLFDRWMPNTGFILGAHDVDALLTKHPDIERRYIKVWLESGAVLKRVINTAAYERSAHLLDRIFATLPRYVEGRGFERARELLDEHRVCIISGPPGIGKTTLAHVLTARAIRNQFEPIEISEDIEEAWDVWEAKGKQVYVYDDFLGRVNLTERLGKNEDHRLSDFIDRVRRSESKLLILTTREYILEDARRTYEELHRLDERLHLVLQLRDYSRIDRARILYNHLWHSDVDAEELLDLLEERRYLEIIDHRNFNPRLIEYLTTVPTSVDEAT